MQEYRSKSFMVRFDPHVCIHSARCVSGLPSVFDVKRRPWIDVDGAEAERIDAQIKECPSGALSFVAIEPDTP